MVSAKEILRLSFRRFGLDLHRFNPASSDEARLTAMLAAHQINLVFDVGANIGQFGKVLRRSGYLGRIVSFEPLSTARKQLVDLANKDSLWDVAEQAALGDQEGWIELHISGNSVSSSVLSMLGSHLSAAPGSAYVGSEKVPVRRLDDIATKYLKNDSNLFLKIDTQGYESKVLRGGGGVLATTIGLQLELSFVPLYEGQCLYDQMFAELKAQGFEIWGMSPAFIDPQSGRLLQVDATFFRAGNNLL